MRPERRQNLASVCRILLLAGLFLATRGIATAERCDLCGDEITGETIYLLTDKLTMEKRHACNECARWPYACFACGLPARKDALKLSDGRVLCARDTKTAVIDPDEAKRLCAEAKEDLDKLLSRFVAFPNNVDLAIVDRVNLLALFKMPGNDYECPNVLGYFRVLTNHNQIQNEISVMSALRAAQLKATCAHEYGHAWVHQNVSEERRRSLARDAEEGFCELTGYLLMDSQREEEQERAILRNGYTHGQIDLFIETEKRYGFNDIVDWMKYGLDAALDSGDLNRIRNVKPARLTQTTAVTSPSFSGNQAPVPDKLMLKGISWSKNKRLALVNNQSFEPGESGKVRLGTTNVTIRCLEVRENSARIQVLDSGEEIELSLSGSPR